MLISQSGVGYRHHSAGKQRRCTGTGTVDTSDLTSVATGAGTASVFGNSGTLVINSGNFVAYTVSGPTSFGSVGGADGSSSSGSVFGLFGFFQQMILPTGYVSGSFISGTEQFKIQQLPDLTLRPAPTPTLLEQARMPTASSSTLDQSRPSRRLRPGR